MWSVWLDCANAQDDLNLCWAHLSEGTFPDTAAQIIWNIDPIYQNYQNIFYKYSAFSLKNNAVKLDKNKRKMLS